MSRKKTFFSIGNIRYPLFGIFLLFSLTACGSSFKSVEFKVNTEPEGSHVVYRLSGGDQPGTPDWIYLGNTPYRGVRLIDESGLSDNSKITLKVMHGGYYDQIKEWMGESFLEEAETKGYILWAPYLVAHPKQ